MAKRRKLTQEEKFARKAERVNRKRREEVPLFADQVEETTAAEQYARWRRNIANGVEMYERVAGEAVKAARWVEEQHYDRLAREVLTPEKYAETRARRDYMVPHGATYCIDVWFQAIAAVVPGFREARVRAVQFPEKPYQPDDGGVSELLDKVLLRLRQIKSDKKSDFLS